MKILQTINTQQRIKLKFGHLATVHVSGQIHSKGKYSAPCTSVTNRRTRTRHTVVSLHSETQLVYQFKREESHDQKKVQKYNLKFTFTR